jgi:hypothetical protein
MPGQINRGSTMGDMLYTLATNPNYKSYLEIGTWNGQGSTKCFLEGLLPRKDDWSFYSLEANPSFYAQATSFWDSIYPMILEDARVNLLLGRIIEVEDITTLKQLQEDGRMLPQYTGYMKEDLDNYKRIENVWERLPASFDVVLLDGGEFSTLAEFEKLKDITKVFMLDDSNMLKTKVIRDLLEQDPRWSTLHRNDNDRNGFSVYEKL